MRLTTSMWTVVQDRLQRDTLGDRMLWEYIERRTFGKLWNQEVGIALPKAEEARIKAIVADIMAEIEG